MLQIIISFSIDSKKAGLQPPPPPPPPPPPFPSNTMTFGKKSAVNNQSTNSSIKQPPQPPMMPTFPTINNEISSQNSISVGNNNCDMMTLKKTFNTKYKLPTFNWIILKPNQVSK